MTGNVIYMADKLNVPNKEISECILFLLSSDGDYSK